MPRPLVDSFRRAFALALLLALAGPLAAAEKASGGSADLLPRLEARFQVLPIEGGVVLVPREPYRGIRSLEIKGSSVAVNGDRVNRSDLEGWLGAPARDVLELLELSPEQQLVVIRGRSARPTPPPPEAPSPPVAEAPEGAPAEAAVEPAAVPEPRPLPPMPPRPPEGAHAAVATNVHVKVGETVDNVLVVSGSATIDGTVEDDVTVFAGPIFINGKVGKDVVAVSGDIHLGADARVGGDVTTFSGQIERHPDAEVDGQVEEVRGSLKRRLRDRDSDNGDAAKADHDDEWDAWRWGWSPAARMFGFSVSLAILVTFALLILLTVAAAPRPVEWVGERIGQDPVRSGLIGLLVSVLIFPVLCMVIVILAISIIGIPVLVVLLPFLAIIGPPLLAVVLLVGYAAVAIRVGLWAKGRFGWSLGDSNYGAALLGVALLGALSLIGDFLGMLGGAFIFGPMFDFLGSLVILAAILVGLGGVLPVWVAGRQVGRWRLPGKRFEPAASQGAPPPPPVDELPEDRAP